MKQFSPSTVKVLEASYSNETDITLWSFELRYWRAIHAEFMTHRVFSRNAGSSRAIPVKKVLAQVWNDPAGPVHWGANQAGMQARVELVGWRRALAGSIWRTAGKVACIFAWSLMKLGLHKQVANRLLEPWQFINVVMSTTELANFYKLRRHEDAQPEFHRLADQIYEAAEAYKAAGLVRGLSSGDWHMIYILPEERRSLPLPTLLKLSTARAARVSYEPFDGNPSVEKECERHDKLVASEPIHASPTEHQAMCIPYMRGDLTANFRGFVQYRRMVEDNVDPETLRVRA